MKTKSLFFIFPVLLLLIWAFTTPGKLQPAQQDLAALGFPEDVAKIFTTSCLDCHVATSKNEKAKKALNFTMWNDYNLVKKAGKLNDICDILTEGKMPPEKYLNHFPDRKLTKEQVEVICKWTKEAASLGNE